MKKITYVLLVLVVIGLGNKSLKAQSQLEGNISLSGAFALYPLAVKWAEEFKKIHPKVKIDISAGGAGKGMTDVLSGMVDIAMVSRDVYPIEIKKGAYPFAVAKDAVVVTISASNPSLSALLAKGIKKDVVNNIWVTGKYKTWGQAFAIPSKAPLRVYTRADACGAAEVFAKYVGKKQEDLIGSGVFGDPGLALAIKKDALGIGFNNIGYAYDYKTKKQIPGVRVLPIDVNNNGKIDPEENFYDSMYELMKAIASGKYPSPPARDLYLVTKSAPKDALVKEFLRFILTDGQQYVNATGYVNVQKEKITTELEKLK